MATSVTANQSLPFLNVSMTNNDWSKFARTIWSEGVIRSALNECAVSQRGAGANMSVDVATGRFYVQADFGEIGVTANLDVAAADATNPRLDSVTAWVNWSSGECGVRILTGTPAGSPSAPALTQSGTFWEVEIARISVAALATSIINANITDKRPWSSGLGFTRVPSVASAASPNIPPGGKLLHIPITGTTNITGLTALPAGTVVILEFAGALRVVNGSNLRLGEDFYTAANSTLTLVSDGTNWWELARQAPVLRTDAENYLINPGFEIWQRGAGAFTANGAYTADRWQIALTGSSTVSVTRITSTISTNGYSAQIAYTHSAGAMRLGQSLADTSILQQLRGKKLTVQCKVKSTVAGTVRLYVNNNGSAETGSYNAGTGEETLVYTTTINASATALTAEVQLNAASATVEVNDFMVYIGDPPAVYVPREAADERARCLQYYERFGGEASVEHFGVGVQYSTTSGTAFLHYDNKAAIPSVTVGTIGTNFLIPLGGGNKVATAVTSSQITKHTCHLAVTWSGAQGAVGDCVVLTANLTTGALIEVEANP